MNQEIKKIQSRALRIHNISYLYRALSYSRDYYLAGCRKLEKKPERQQEILEKAENLFFDGDEADLAGISCSVGHLKEEDRYIIYGFYVGRTSRTSGNRIIDYLKGPETDFAGLYYDHVKRNMLAGILLSID